MTTKETAHQIIAELIERFEEQKHSYKRSDYNETLVKQNKNQKRKHSNQKRK